MSDAPAEGLVPVRVARAIGAGSPDYVIRLAAADDEDPLVVSLDRDEALMLTQCLDGDEAPRPLAHPFACAVLEAADGTLVAAVIGPETDLGHPQAALWIQAAAGELTPAARVSDALAVSLCAGLPILRTDGLLADRGPLIEPLTEYRIEELEPRDPEEDVLGVHRLAVLADVDGPREYAVYIEAQQADAIWLAMAAPAPARLRVHDTLAQALGMLDATVERLVIGEIVESTIHASLNLRVGDQVKQVDCRPSDGIALAQRVGAPMLMRPKTANLLALGQGD